MAEVKKKTISVYGLVYKELWPARGHLRVNAVGVKSQEVEEEGRRKVGRRNIWVWFAFFMTGMKLWRCLPTECHGVLSFYRSAIGC